MAATPPDATHQALTDDGVRLALRRFLPPRAAPRPREPLTLLFTHAMMASGAYLDRVARRAADQAGADAWVLDFRGHGASTPPRAGRGPGGNWCFDDYVRLDLPAAIATISRVSSLTPSSLTYVGHSLGGLVGAAAFGTGAAPLPRRLVLAAVNVWTRPSLLRSPRRAIVARLFVASAHIARGRIPARALGIGTDDEPLDYARQFATWLRHGWRSRDGLDYRAAVRSITSPVLALVGTGDWMCTPADALDFLAPLPKPPQIRVVPGANHFQIFGDGVDFLPL